MKCRTCEKTNMNVTSRRPHCKECFQGLLRQQDTLCPCCEVNMMSSVVRMCSKCYRQKKRDEQEAYEQEHNEQMFPSAKGVTVRPDYFARSDSIKAQ